MSQHTSPYRVLARKYRPSCLSEVIGQEEVVTLLSHSFSTGRLPHAIIFTGIRGVGKTTLARLIAKALNCTGSDNQRTSPVDPCGVCPSCLAITEDRHLDVIEMDAASRTSVDDIREIIEASRYATVSGRYKVYVIDEVHMLSKSAFNALLKTLEEPPPHVKFIFATTELHKVPKTILSRCVRLQLKRMEPTTLLTYLGEICAKENVTADTEALRMIVRASEGSVRDSLSLLDQAITLCDEGSAIHITVEAAQHMVGTLDHGRLWDIFHALLSADTPKTLGLFRTFYAQGLEPSALFSDIARLIHLTSLLKAQPLSGDEAMIDPALLDHLQTIAPTLSVPVLSMLWQAFGKAQLELSTASMPYEAAEMLLVRLCHLATWPAPGMQVAAVAMAPSTGTLTFDALLSRVRDAKEALLFHHLKEDVHFIKWTDTALHIRLTPKAPKDLLKRITDFLRGDGTPWIVQLSSEEGQPTVAQVEAVLEDAFRKQVLVSPEVKAVLHHFPGATLTKVERQANQQEI